MKVFERATSGANVIELNGKVYGKVGINSANLSSRINSIKSTNVAICNDAPLCYIQC
jgi:hypothetical protein